MDDAPAGFTLLPGSDPVSPGQATRVFAVARGGQTYVCKRLRSRALSEPWMQQRLAAEGRVLAGLAGCASPRLVASGEDAHGPWIVMEHVALPPLASRLGASDATWLERATGAAFDALSTVHAAGVVHGDVSPDNVLLSEDAARA
ncbi:MAG TPA: hypothetical protein VIJ22_19875, partial [Polyangiaceae bacterium]